MTKSYPVNPQFKDAVLNEYVALASEIAQARSALLVLEPRLAAVIRVIKIYEIEPNKG